MTSLLGNGRKDNWKEIRVPGRNRTYNLRNPRLHERFFACDSDVIFSKFVKITRVATLAQVLRWRQLKNRKKNKKQKHNREKLNELNFSRQNHRLCHSCSHHRAPATRQFPEKIASPSQAKNRSCSRGFTLVRCFNPWATGNPCSSMVRASDRCYGGCRFDSCLGLWFLFSCPFARFQATIIHHSHGHITPLPSLTIILMTSVGIKPTTSGLDLPSLCRLSYEGLPLAADKHVLAELLLVSFVIINLTRLTAGVCMKVRFESKVTRGFSFSPLRGSLMRRY